MAIETAASASRAGLSIAPWGGCGLLLRKSINTAMPRSILLLVVCLSVLLAGPVSARAISFDAEKEYGAIFVIESGSSLGSGFALGQDCILTNAHVIGDRQHVRVTTRGGQQLAASVFAIDEGLDLAVLKVQGAALEHLDAGDERALQVGSDVYAIGAPESLAYTLTRGVLSAKDRKVGGRAYLQFDAAINSGNSGGPLLNDAGQVIGVITLKIDNAEGIGMAIPMSSVRDYLRFNGIEVDAVGNVVGPVARAATAAPAGARPDPETPAPAGGSVISTVVLVIVGGAVLALVVALSAVMLKKRRTVSPKLDETDRTDFDIEILE